MRILITPILLLVFADNAVGAQGTITGKETVGWETGYYNVLVAEIRDIEKDLESPNRYRAKIAPKALLAGTLDPSAHPTLPTVFYAGKAIGAIERAPQNGDLVMAVVKLERPVDTNTGVSTFIFSDICTFMPGKSAMVVLKSLEDAVVTETLKRLQEARAHPQR